MKINETIKLVANNLWLYKKEKSYVDFRNALTSVAEEQQEITKQEMIEKACNVYADLLSAHGYNPIDVNNEVVRMKKELEE